LFVLFWSALVTYILMKLISLVLRGARYSDEILEVGDMAIHDESFPKESARGSEIMEEARHAGIGEGTPPDPGLAPSTHPNRRTALENLRVLRASQDLTVVRLPHGPVVGA